MILAIIISFLVGSALTGSAMYLAQKARIQLMLEDTIVALRDQATESFRTGYMRGYGDKTVQRNVLADARNVYASANK